MYVRPKQLWWLLPIFLGLFFLGVSLGALHNRHDGKGVPIMAEAERAEADRMVVADLLDQLTEQKERPFEVYLQDHVLSGRFQGQRFQLSGEIGGHHVELRRSEQDVSVTVDGQVQEQTALPYALFTPQEHAVLLKDHLRSVTPLAVSDPSNRAWQGYRLSIPAGEVTSLLATWLGPSFPIQEAGLARQIAVDYHVWYDGTTRELRQLDVLLQMKTPAGMKQDQLRFRL
ncbi:hypothetical protein ACT91Q_02520 [Brevibacillus thermoruber]|jgi:hypothetical protein|uniref:Uncharacterized protein n=1 Tax=Brevibacillus thermoruber TaxID=33942 RepID=A0A9X3Z1N0_9BACL|nr:MULTISPECIES: hypothetical protein [Brevibacillus]MDA5106818.1 hypothetical protein [Brevibacillus thermoruber]TRY28184.1 hypothetical protein FOI68_02165 [Brevibacillus sp. LEMMJ03]